MKKIAVLFGGLATVGLGGSLWLFSAPPMDADAAVTTDVEAIARGEYLFIAGGCISCHKGDDDESVPSGGYALESDFGTFYAPNITPDLETGIGNWSGADFLAALKYGRAPDGSFYYPAFPYRSYAGLTDEDVLDMAAYIMSLNPVRYQEPEPELVPWLQRPLVAGWNLLADFSQPEPEVFEDELIARGAYLARNLAHCGECHTPRNGLGIPDWSREFAGAELGEEVVEAIDGEALEEWSFANFDLFLILGMKPEGEFVGGDMNEVIEFNTSNLTDEDRDALAAFFTRHHAGD